MIGYMPEFFKTVCTFTTKITEEILPITFGLAKFVRKCMYPDELLEEFYLHLICFQEENTKQTEFLVHLIPFLTLYLKPPKTIQKCLLAFLAKSEFSFTYMPLSIDYPDDE